MNMNRTGIFGRKICSAAFIILAVVADASAANVVQRNTVSSTNRVSATRPTAAASRMPTMTVNVGTTSQSTTSVSDTPATTTTETTTTNTPEPTPDIENKSSQFGTGLTSKSETQIDTAATNLAELVRAQRAALDAAGASAEALAATQNVTGNGENTCDTILRECMIQKCGNNFAKCVADTDTTFFDKMDTCRRTTNCTGREYQLFSVEIKADRDLNAMLANYNATIDCGNNYDSCIIAQCGANYSKCIGKSAGDTAIAKCESIAKSCVERDSGLAMRTMGVFGELRQNAERQIATDEQKLYALRDRMRTLCTRLGAMFDERSLDCVYTVNFYAGNDNTLFASKKLYAGSTFDCTQNWFGIDVTTYRENALRETRAQTAASSAMLGSGVGQAVGALTSGAIDRAVDRFRADNALEDAINECMETHNMTESECRAKVSPSSENTDKTGNADETFKAAKAQIDDINRKIEEGGTGLSPTVDGSSVAAATSVAASEEDDSTKKEVVAEQQAIDDINRKIEEGGTGLSPTVDGSSVAAATSVAASEEDDSTKKEVVAEQQANNGVGSINSSEYLSNSNGQPKFLNRRDMNSLTKDPKKHIKLFLDEDISDDVSAFVTKFVNISKNKDNQVSIDSLDFYYGNSTTRADTQFVLTLNYPNMFSYDDYIKDKETKAIEMSNFCREFKTNVCPNDDKCMFGASVSTTESIQKVFPKCSLVYKR